MDHPQMKQIYVALLDQGPDAWRRVDAACVGQDAYRILSSNDRRERWEYLSGEVVRCRTMILPSGERVLAATQRVGRPPNTRPDVSD